MRESKQKLKSEKFLQDALNFVAKFAIFIVDHYLINYQI